MEAKEAVVHVRRKPYLAIPTDPAGPRKRCEPKFEMFPGQHTLLSQPLKSNRFARDDERTKCVSKDVPTEK